MTGSSVVQGATRAPVLSVADIVFHLSARRLETSTLVPTKEVVSAAISQVSSLSLSLNMCRKRTRFF